MVATIARNI